MDRLVITVLGNDRAGLVEALSGAITDNGGNWERSELIELAGKFAGVVLITVAPSRSADLRAALDQIQASGLLAIEVTAASEAEPRPGHRFQVSVTGQDHPGIVHDLSHALAEIDVSIDEFHSEVVPAPMGGELFVAGAVVDAPEDVTLDEVQKALEAVASDLMIDVDSHDP